MVPIVAAEIRAGLAAESLERCRRLVSGETMHVVICGSGVIGACTAYFLSRRGIDVTVVERTEVAAAASGKAGGFLALTGEALAELIADGVAHSTDLTPFDLIRLPPLDPSLLRSS